MISSGAAANSPSGRTESGRKPAPLVQIPDHELLRRIGRGSYGEVWLARSVTGQFRAVKIVTRQGFEDDHPYEREFSGIEKAEPISRTHEGLVDILHVGRKEEAGCFYYVMELADDQQTGQQFDPDRYQPKTLRSELRTRGRLPPGECVQIVLGLLEGLDHLHQHGLVHRDIKPSNIIFVDGLPKLADIGLVTGADETRSFVGTEGYVPPEGPGKPRADLYALGKVLYEMCTGRDRQDFPELPTSLRDLPERKELLELNQILGLACAGEARRRYGSAKAMHADLRLLERGRSVRRHRRMRRTMVLAALTVFLLGVTALVVTSIGNAKRKAAALDRAARPAALDSDGDGLSDDNERGFGRYQLIAGNFTWAEAKADAERRGGHLATIISQAEWEAILEVIGRSGGTFANKSTAIGGTDAEQEGVWKWITGEPWSFTRWHQNGIEPSNTDGNENALCITSYAGFPWNDSALDAKVTHYLLEQGFFTNPSDPDTDGDGFSDAAELALGTCPVDAASFPKDLTGFRDEFNGTAIDASHWIVQKAFGNSSVTATNGRVTLRNAGRLIAAWPFANVRIKGRFRFAGASDDSFAVSLRSDSRFLEGQGGWPSGLLVRLKATATAAGESSGSVAVFDLSRGALLTQKAVAPQPNTDHEFQIVDDGRDITVFVGTPGEPVLAQPFTPSDGNRIVFQNRELTVAPESARSVEIDYLEITELLDDAAPPSAKP